MNFSNFLFPCPFCGEKIKIGLHSFHRHSYVECETCESMGPTGVDRDSAAFQWNSRAEADNRERRCLRCGRQLLLEKEPGYRMCVTCRRVASETSLTPGDFADHLDGNRRIRKFVGS